MTRSSPEISVVLATAGSAPNLDEQLDALAAQVDAPPFEVVVVANRSPADLEPRLETWRDRLEVRVVRADAKAGLAFARNTGVRAARGSLLVFLDDDDRVDSRYLAAMSEALRHADAAGARIVLGDLNRGWAAEVRDVAQVGGLLDVAGQPCAYGATLGVRREVFDRVGPFDEALDGIAGEDVEWCVRAGRAGATMVFVPEAVLHYRLRTSYRDLWRQGLRYGRGGQIVAGGWTGWWSWLRTLPGPLRLTLSPKSPGRRRRGVFLVARRLGAAQERRAPGLHAPLAG